MKAAERAKDHLRLQSNLRMIQDNSSVTELSELLGISKPTFISRMKEPWARFTYDDLLAIAEHFRIDFVQMLTGELKIR